jgi:hypothetical protein
METRESGYWILESWLRIAECQLPIADFFMSLIGNNN